jgi:hypothetical protein
MNIIELIGGIFSGIGKTAIDIRTAFTGKDPALDAKLQELVLQIDAQRDSAIVALAQAQIEVNKVEAASGSKFVSWARPSVIWIGSIVIFYTYVLHPLLTAAGAHLPVLEMSELWPVITGILGLGVMRSAEKFKGVATP